MVSKIFPVVESNQYAEKELSSNTLHLGPSPSIISKRQLQVSSTVIIIMYIYHALINALSAHMIHINLNMIFYTHVEHSLPK